MTVAVIEAGDWHATVDGINIPGMFPTLGLPKLQPSQLIVIIVPAGMAGQTLMKPELDWAFMSVPQKYANNRPIYQPR